MKIYVSFIAIFLFFASAIWSSGTPEELTLGLYAKIITSKGELIFELDTKNTPLTTANFAGLAKGLLSNSAYPFGKPFYDGITVYRTVPGYAIFSGDPTGQGDGGPGYTLPREVSGQFSAGTKGALLMDGLSWETSGSRFFILLNGDSFLDTKYTCFGRLVTGLGVLRKIKDGDSIDSIEIVSIGAEANNFSFNQDSFHALMKVAREEEIDQLETLDPALPNAIRQMDEEKRQKTLSGIYYTIKTEGQGATPIVGDQLSMHYTGTLTNGEVFDSTRKREQTFDFTFGRDGIIPGWIEMLAEMQEGEIRLVIMPPELAYGNTGYGPIPPNSWLIFEMELIHIED